MRNQLSFEHKKSIKAENLRIFNPQYLSTFPNTNTNERIFLETLYIIGWGELTLSQQQLQRLRGLGQGGEVEGGLTSAIL